MMEQEYGSEYLHYISGEVDGDIRENIRHYMEQKTEQKQVLIASLQTLSTGVNIKNIQSIVFTSPTKSQITTLQSIGRGLRLHSDKEMLTVYDLVDSTKFAVRHFQERVKIYDSEGFSYDFKKLSL
jgi:superfamily II DNA or RNA helicase